VFLEFEYLGQKSSENAIVPGKNVKYRLERYPYVEELSSVSE